MSRRVTLYEHRGSTSIFIDAEIDESGDVVVSGQDIGEAPERFFGDSDYEYWVHVRTAQKPALLAALRAEAAGEPPAGRPKGMADYLRESVSRVIPMRSGRHDDLDREILTLIETQFSGRSSAFNDFREFLDKHEIASEFGSWA